ncbi:MAG: hypothetical protein HZB19_15015 [Chloroflexi bacterium]|nr:hypothetical protein [Chloroflexota bacterium]
MNKLYEALEEGLQAIEQGTAIDSIVARYPDLADELRPILEASSRARALTAPDPSPEAMRRGRAKLLQRAAELREAKIAPRRRVIPGIQRFAISFLLAALFLLSGTGLVNASASALPGESLYTVKRTWEDMRLFFIFDQKQRESLKVEFENERLHEVSELLAEGRHETIQFAGELQVLKDRYYVSGIRVVILDSTKLPAEPLQNGAAVVVTGRTNAEGFVEAQSLKLLPSGTLVPEGKPVEMDTEDESPADSPSETEPTPEPGDDAGGDGSDNQDGGESDKIEMEGTVETITGDTLVINGLTVSIAQAQIIGDLKPGAIIKIQGYYDANGNFIVTRIEVIGSNSGDENQNSNSGSNSNDDNTNDGGGDENTNDGGDDNSNDGGGDDNTNGGGGDDNTNDGGGDDNTNDGGGDDNTNDGGGDDNTNDGNDNDSNDNDSNDNNSNDNDNNDNDNGS